MNPLTLDASWAGIVIDRAIANANEILAAENRELRVKNERLLQELAKEREKSAAFLKVIKELK